MWRLWGIIPAGAGLTYSHIQNFIIHWDHPRGCGAHSALLSRIHGLGGSSPRVRGSPNLRLVNTFLQGIIPAGAGLTSCVHAFFFSGRDHPRGCGAHLRMSCVAWMRPGSSPRVRGSRPCPGHKCYARGIIPAGAGLTQSWNRSWDGARDHPRGCGAHRLACS